MRATNLTLHIVSLLLMLPDALFVGLSFLVGLAYLRGKEIIIVPLFVLVFFTGFFFSLVGGIIQFAKGKKASPKAYMIREVIIHGLAALSFGVMIVYTLIVILNPAPKVPQLSTSSANVRVSVVDMIGFGLAVAGIVFNLVAGISKNKKAAAAVAATPAVPQVEQNVSRPKFCSQCGTPTGGSGDFCRNCGSRLV